MAKDPLIYLSDILVACEKIRRFTAAGKQEFMRDEKTQDAVARNFEIIGEAAKGIPARIRKLAPDVPWKEAAGFRDILIHAYDSIDLARMWDSVVIALPPFEQKVRELVAKLEARPQGSG